MKRTLIVGLIAGLLAGIVSMIFKISGLYSLFSVTPYLEVPFNIQIIAQVEIIWTIIWGVIWTVFYAIFYDYIPSQGMKKGLIYGLIIWILVSLRPKILNFIYGYGQWSIPDALTGFFSICITYGLLIGFLYKKPSD
jgi:hypothetical protein